MRFAAMANIFLLEDDKILSKGISIALKKDEHMVTAVYGYLEALKQYQKQKYDLFLLDINLPDGNGLEFCEKIRETSETPVLFLTANDTEEDMLEGFGVGCDDYISKPFSIEVLRKKVLAVLKRSGVGKFRMKYRDLELDKEKCLVLMKGQEIHLTSTEYKLLLYLMENRGRVVTKAMLLEQLWDIDGNFVDVEGDFPSIISQEIWNKAQAIRESRVKPVCVSAGKNTHSKRDSRDIWVNKLRCSCGSSYRKNKWHTKLDGKTSYGYQCYNQLNNGIKRKRAEIGLDTEGYCDSRMITDWKLDFMAKALLEHLWTERKESVLIALDLIKYYYKEEKSNETQSDTVTIQAKLDKANSRLTNLIAMRADGEISKDEYQAMRSPVDEEIKKLQKALDEIPQEKSNPKGLDIEGIRSTLNSFIDFSGSTISHDVVNQFVYLITPTSDTTFDWYVNLNGTADVKATFTAEGRKKNCIIKLEEIEKISSVHREKNEDNAHFIKNPHIFTYLHRLLSRRACNPRR